MGVVVFQSVNTYECIKRLRKAKAEDFAIFNVFFSNITLKNTFGSSFFTAQNDTLNCIIFPLVRYTYLNED